MAADSFVINLAGGILRKLDSPDLQEMGELRITVSLIQAVILDAEKSERGAGIRRQLGDLQEVMYDIDDVLDDWLAHSLRRRRLMSSCRVSKEVRLFFSSSNKLVYGVKVARRIRHITSRLDDIASRFRGFGILRVREEEVDVPQRRETSSIFEYGIFVGRDADKEAIVEDLLFEDYEENVVTVSIVGIGGMGETVLAQSVFRDERVLKLFELRIWVCVANDFDLRLILQKIGENLSYESLRDFGIASLKAIIHEKIRTRRFLLVLDDVWNEDRQKWLMLVDLLYLGARGSRILLTTRNAQVAQVTTNPIRVHYLKGLSKDDSWLLFERCAFETGQVPSILQREIGDAIISKCAGNPMAIRAMGRVLYFKRTDSEWSEFSNRELWTMEESGIFSILRLSYDNLPPGLKQCFACCSLFPKNHKMRVLKLINLWMVLGFLRQSVPSSCLEDIGLSHITELLGRSFFEEVEKDEFGNC